MRDMVNFWKGVPLGTVLFWWASQALLFALIVYM